MKAFLREFRKNIPFLLMVAPGFLWFLILKILPLFGLLIAFKDFRFSAKGFFASIFNSKWVGFENFKFLFTTSDAWIITRNTIFYNLLFIIVGLVFSVFVAILVHEILYKRLAKILQSFMFLPHFLSWVVVSYFLYSFLSMDKGIVNNILKYLSLSPISWYSEPKYWPYILVFMSQWKSIGYSSVIYLAAITSIDKSYYEAALMEGATKWQQIRYITLPELKNLMIILTLLALGRIFSADFGLFYQLPMNSGALYDVTNVIDTYVYRGLMFHGDIGMTTAAGLYQSVVGFFLILGANWLIKKYEKNAGLF